MYNFSGFKNKICIKTFKFTFYLLICMFFGWGVVCHGTGMENSFQESVLFLHHVDSGNQTKAVRLGSSACNCRAIWLAPKHLLGPVCANSMKILLYRNFILVVLSIDLKALHMLGECLPLDYGPSSTKYLSQCLGSFHLVLALYPIKIQLHVFTHPYK